jgi:exopolyphosphatase/guanosine-5'-triphosphate,3'-diphosphate pyrophosphatase
MSYDERISKLKLRPDRADVIVPAIHLTLTLMKAFQIQSLLLPQVGLKEGILLTL